MTTFALNNLWTYLQGLSLSQSDREWLANKLIMPVQKKDAISKDDALAKFLEMEGIWSEDAEGEESAEGENCRMGPFRFRNAKASNESRKQRAESREQRR